MDVQVINLRIPADLAKRARDAAGSGKLTSFIVSAIEEKLSGKGVAYTPPTPSPGLGPIKAPSTGDPSAKLGALDPFETPSRSVSVQPGPNTSTTVGNQKAISNLLRKS